MGIDHRHPTSSMLANIITMSRRNR